MTLSASYTQFGTGWLSWFCLDFIEEKRIVYFTLAQQVPLYLEKDLDFVSELVEENGFCGGEGTL